jgi:superoxide oxidase
MSQIESRTERREFDRITRFLHWLTALVVAAAFALVLSARFATSGSQATTIIQLHRSLGITVWVVMLGRLVWRQFSHFPGWSAGIPPAMRITAQCSEYALYALMLAQPILGLLETNAHGERVNLFFLGQLPALIGMDRPLSRQLLAAHQAVGFCLLGLIAVHATAALYHHFWRRDDTLDAMLPRQLRRQSVDNLSMSCVKGSGRCADG